MQLYSNLGRDSGITHYENGDGYIIVVFATGYWKQYTYTNSSAGNSVVLHMQSLARQGQGLNSYIIGNKPNYASKC
jgi:hypothetical protein